MRRSWLAGIVVPMLVGMGLSGCAAGQKRLESAPVVQVEEGQTEKPGRRFFSWRWWSRTKAEPAHFEQNPSDDSDVLTIGSLEKRNPSGVSGDPWPDPKSDRLSRYFPTIGRRQATGSQNSASTSANSAATPTRDRGVRQARANADEVADTARERADQDLQLQPAPTSTTPGESNSQASAKGGDAELKVESIVTPSTDDARTPQSVAASASPAVEESEPRRDSRFGPSTDRTATLLGIKPAEPENDRVKATASSREDTAKRSNPPLPEPTMPAIGEPTSDASLKIASADQPAPSAPKPSLSVPTTKPAPPAPGTRQPKVEVPSAPKVVAPAAPPASEPPSLVPAAPKAEDEPGAVPPPPEASKPGRDVAPPAPVKPTSPEAAPESLSTQSPAPAPPSAAPNWMPTSQTVPTSQLASGQSFSAPTEQEDHAWGLGLFSGKLLPCLKKKFHKEPPVVYASAQSMFLPSYYNCEQNAPVASPQNPLPAPQAPFASAQSVVAGHKKKCEWLENCPLIQKLQNCHVLKKIKDFKAQCKIKMCPCCSGGHKSPLCTEGVGLASPQGVPPFSTPQTFAELDAAQRSPRTESRDLSKNRDIIQRVSADDVGETSQR